MKSSALIILTILLISSCGKSIIGPGPGSYTDPFYFPYLEEFAVVQNEIHAGETAEIRITYSAQLNPGIFLDTSLGWHWVGINPSNPDPLIRTVGYIIADDKNAHSSPSEAPGQVIVRQRTYWEPGTHIWRIATPVKREDGGIRRELSHLYTPYAPGVEFEYRDIEITVLP